MVDFRLLVDDFNAPSDIFVAMRVGDSQKLGRISSERLYKFPQKVVGEHRTGTLEVFQRISRTTLNIGADAEAVQNVAVPVADQIITEPFKFRVMVGATALEGSPRTDATTEVMNAVEKPKATAAKAYLDKHNLEKRLMMAMRDVVTEFPEDPVPFIAARLAQYNKLAGDAPFEMVLEEFNKGDQPSQAGYLSKPEPEPEQQETKAEEAPQEEPTYSVESVLPMVLPQVLNIVKEAARQHLVTVMAGVNEEFRDWLDKRDDQRNQLLGAVAELSTGFELIKAAVRVKIVSPEMDGLCDLATDALAAASAEVQPLSDVFMQKDGEISQMVAAEETGVAPTDEFMNGLLQKLGPIVTQSVQEHVSVAMEHATQEFEPWLQQSDDKRTALFAHIDALKGQLDAVKAEVQQGKTAEAPQESQEPTFSVASVLPILVDIVKEVAKQHVTAVMSGVSAEFNEWLQKRDLQRTEMLGAVADLSNELQVIKANVVAASQQAPCDLSTDALGAASINVRPDGTQGVSEEFTKGLLARLQSIVCVSVQDHVTLAMADAKQQFDPWLQHSVDTQAALSENVETLKRNLDTLKAIAIAKLSDEIELIKAAVSSQDLAPEAAAQDGTQAAPEAACQPASSTQIAEAVEAVRAESKDEMQPDSEPSRPETSDAEAGERRPAAEPASSSDARPDALSTMFTQKATAGETGEALSASGPPMNDFTKGLLDELGGIVRESVQEHVNTAMRQTTQEFESWSQQSDEKRAALAENIEDLKRSLDSFKAP